MDGKRGVSKMTDEYILKQAAIDATIEDGKKIPTAAIRIMHDIKALPAADVAPVVHGKWMKEDRGHVEYCAVCDQCGFDWMWSDREYFKFCPNCGAKMDAKEKG